MYKTGKNKAITKLVAASFALNTLGGMIIPIQAFAAEGDKVANNAKATNAEASKDEAAKKQSTEKEEAEKAKKEADVADAKDYKAKVEAATSAIVSLTGEEDDLQFINKVISLCQDSTGKTTVADNYAKLVASAQEAKDKAAAQGKEPDEVTKTILAADERIHRIATDLKNAGTIDTSVATEKIVQSAIATYQKGVADLKVCKTEAVRDGKNPDDCKLSEAASSAANMLMNKGLQQVNATSTSPEKIQNVDAKGSSKIENKDTVWHRNEKTGLWEQDTTTTEIDCSKTGQIAVDGKCVTPDPAPVTCEEGQVKMDGKCVTPAPKCEEGETLVDGKCVAASDDVTCKEGEVAVKEGEKTVCKTPDPKCDVGEVLVENEGKKACVNPEIKCEEGQEVEYGWEETKCVPIVKCDEGQVKVDGKCVTPDPKCIDTQELKDGKCVDKLTCPEGQEVKEGACVAKTPDCTDSQELKDGKCVDKVISSTSTTESSPAPASEVTPASDGNQGDGDKKSGSNKLLGALGTIGALAALLSGPKTTTPEGTSQEEGQLKEGQLQYAFNFLIDKSKGIHYLPANSDDIKFKLFDYRMGSDAKDKKWAKAVLQIPIVGPDGKATLHQTDPMPIELNKITTLFPTSITDKDIFYKPLQKFGSLERLPASTFGRPYYVMKVVVSDGVVGHEKGFYIHYDFQSASVVIRNEDTKLTTGTNIINETPFSLDAKGQITGATWDEKDQTCYINVNGTVYDKNSRESVDEEVSIASQRYNKDGCDKIGTEGKGTVLDIKNINQSTNADGEKILVDTTASASTLENLNMGREYFRTDAGYGIVFERKPVDILVDSGWGEQYRLEGYTSDGDHMYDSNGVMLDEAGERNEAAFVNARYGTNYSRIGICKEPLNDHDPEVLGGVCGYKTNENGEEVISDRLTKGTGFHRNELIVPGNTLRADMKTMNDSDSKEYLNGSMATSTIEQIKQVVAHPYEYVRDAFLSRFKSDYKPAPNEYGMDRQVYVDEIAGGSRSRSAGKEIDKGEPKEIVGKNRQRIDKDVKGMNGESVKDVADEEKAAAKEEAQKQSPADKVASAAAGVAEQAVNAGSTGRISSSKARQPIMQ